MEHNTLRQGVLRSMEALAQSMALLSPLVSIAFSSSLVARFAGAAAPLAFVLAALACLCLAYVLMRFARLVASAGGLSTYIARGLFPAAGFLGGWMYGGAFVLGSAFTLALGSVFLSTLFAHAHLSLDWFAIYGVLLLALFFFAFFDIRLSTRSQLVLAAGGVLVALVLAVMILAKGGDSGVSLRPFSPPALPGGLGGLFFATMVSFTAFVGFEGAAPLGEETAHATQAIPRAIFAAVLVGAIFYIVLTYALSIGYGVAHATTWAMDQAPLDTLAQRYAGPVLAVILDGAVACSALSAGLAGLTVTARMLYAMGRDRRFPAVFGLTHPRYHSPWVGIVTVLLALGLLGATLGRSLGPLTFIGLLATIATQGVLFTYILVAIAGAVCFRRSDAGGNRRLAVVFDMLLPLIAVLVCGTTIYSSVWPVPPPPFTIAPSVSVGWLLLGLFWLTVLWRTRRGQGSRSSSRRKEGLLIPASEGKGTRRPTSDETVF